MSAREVTATRQASIDGERAVVAEVLAGASYRFEALIRRHNALVFRTARAVLRSDSDAEDCAQEAWMRAYERLAQYDGSGAFTSWVARIAFREAIAMLRAKKRARSVPLPEGSTPALFDESGQVTPDQEARIERAEVQRELEEAIDHLPGVLRDVFVLRDVQELPAGEVATILGITEGNVRVRLHRARQAMRLRVAAAPPAPSAFAFDGVRCDRIVGAVLGAIAARRPPSAPSSRS